MKTPFATLAACLTVGLVFASGCERATEPGTESPSSPLTVGASTRASSTPTALPDLTIDANQLQSSLLIKTQNFKASSCALDEGCVDCVGKRKLLKFAVVIPNIGNADLVLGSPTDPNNSNLFVYSPCHDHYHVIGFTTYELLNSAGTTVVAGHKQAFCLEDFTQVDPGAGAAKYTCSNQGIQVGWEDVYAPYLDCQWIDITDLPPGQYRLKIKINATPGLSSKLTESDDSNNTAEVPVTIPATKKK